MRLRRRSAKDAGNSGRIISRWGSRAEPSLPENGREEQQPQARRDRIVRPRVRSPVPPGDTYALLVSGRSVRGELVDEDRRVKVTHVGAEAAPIEPHVAWTEVAVDDPSLVKVGEGSRQLSCKPEEVVDRHHLLPTPSVIEVLGQRPSAQVLEDHVLGLRVRITVI